MSESFFDFTKGLTAKNLKNKGIESFQFWRNIQMEELQSIKPEDVEIIGNYAFYKSGEDYYLLFYYKPTYFTRWKLIRQFPKYHPYFCETREHYEGYVYANKMPVDVYSRDEKQTFEDIYLRLCKNCEKAIFQTYWTWGNKPWYEVILEYVANEESPIYKGNGYHAMWKQISEAYREKVNWKCERCRIKLSGKEDKYYLHTHHRDGNPFNNDKANFEALCLLCHALEHKDHLKSRQSFR